MAFWRDDVFPRLNSPVPNNKMNMADKHTISKSIHLSVSVFVLTHSNCAECESEMQSV